MIKHEEWITPEGLKQIYEWTQAGYSYKSISEFIGISKSTLYTWMKKYPEFGKALREGRNPPTREDVGYLDAQAVINYLKAEETRHQQQRAELEKEINRLNLELRRKGELIAGEIKRLEEEGHHQTAQVLKDVRVLLDL